MNSIKYFFLQHLLPHWYAKVAENKLKRKMNEFKEVNINIEISHGQDANELKESLKEYIIKERKRKGSIDEKAKSGLFIVTLAITIVLTSLTLLQGKSTEIKIGLIPLLFLVSGVIYLLLSGITSISTLNIREFYDLDLNDIIIKDGDKYRTCAADEINVVNELYKYIKLNQITTNTIANYLYATFIGIRNGIILIGVFFVMVVGQPVVEKYLKNNNISEYLDMIQDERKSIIFSNIINSIGYFLLLLGSIGMLLLVLRFSGATRIKDMKYVPERFLKLDGYKLWWISWLLIILGTIYQLTLIWI